MTIVPTVAHHFVSSVLGQDFGEEEMNDVETSEYSFFMKILI
jgi:hypothetical protein